MFKKVTPIRAIDIKEIRLQCFNIVAQEVFGRCWNDLVITEKIHLIHLLVVKHK